MVYRVMRKHVMSLGSTCIRASSVHSLTACAVYRCTAFISCTASCNQRSSFFIHSFVLVCALPSSRRLCRSFGEASSIRRNAQYSDLTITHWPAFAYTRDQLQATGQIPLWRSSILSGTPFAADPLSGLFYPPHWIAFVPSVPLSLAFNLLMVFHLALAAGSDVFSDAALERSDGRRR